MSKPLSSSRSGRSGRSGRRYHVRSYVVPAHEKSYPRKREPRCVVQIESQFYSSRSPSYTTRDITQAMRLYKPEALQLAAELGGQVWEHV